MNGRWMEDGNNGRWMEDSTMEGEQKTAQWKVNGRQHNGKWWKTAQWKVNGRRHNGRRMEDGTTEGKQKTAQAPRTYVTVIHALLLLKIWIYIIYVCTSSPGLPFSLCHICKLKYVRIMELHTILLYPFATCIPMWTKHGCVCVCWWVGITCVHVCSKTVYIFTLVPTMPWIQQVHIACSRNMWAVDWYFLWLG